MTIPNTFKAAVLTKLNQELEILEIKMPTLAFGQVLVKIQRAGVCRSQLMEYQGKRGEDNYLPHLLGHEAVGVVYDIGPGVQKVHKGQRVILSWLKGEGIETGGTILESSCGAKINAGPVNTFSQFSVVSENRVTLCPEGFSDNIAVLLGCALPTGGGIVLNQIKPTKEDSILLVGLGGIGIAALLVLSYFSPKEIVVIDKSLEKLALAKSLGATHCMQYTDDIKKVVQCEFPNGFDFAIECAGFTHTIELAFELLSKTGKLYFASHPEHGAKIKLDPHALISGKKIFGSWGGASLPDRDFKIIGEIVQSLNISADLFESNVYQLNDINKAFSDLNNGKVIRAMISFYEEAEWT